MSVHSRRSILSALGLVFPIGLSARAGASPTPDEAVPSIRFRSFEDAVREAFAQEDPTSPGDLAHGPSIPCRRIAIGQSDLVQAGIQGCHNDRPFAGFPAGRLRIVRISSEPGSVHRGVRLYLTSVDVTLAAGRVSDAASRPLNFASLPPAPCLC